MLPVLSSLKTIFPALVPGDEVQQEDSAAEEMARGLSGVSKSLFLSFSNGLHALVNKLRAWVKPKKIMKRDYVHTTTIKSSYNL